MMGLSAAIGAGSGVLGLFVSYHHDVAAGGTIVLVATLAFGIVWLAAPTHGFVATRVWARRRAAAVRSGDAKRIESITGPGRPADDRGPVA
jgi:manganese/iron transport system permease protein